MNPEISFLLKTYNSKIYLKLLKSGLNKLGLSNFQSIFDLTHYYELKPVVTLKMIFLSLFNKGRFTINDLMINNESRYNFVRLGNTALDKICFYMCIFFSVNYKYSIWPCRQKGSSDKGNGNRCTLDRIQYWCYFLVSTYFLFPCWVYCCYIDTRPSFNSYQGEHLFFIII